METGVNENDIPVLPDSVPVTMPTLPPSRPINTLQQFRAISDPIRSTILGIVQLQPATAKQIADRLSASPGAIGHHLHVLEDAGLVQIVARRLVHGIVANFYTRTARIFAYNLPPDVIGDQPVSLEIFGKAREEFVAVATGDQDKVCSLAFPHVRLSPGRVAEYEKRLESLLDDLLVEPADPSGDVYGVFLALFKAPAYMQGDNVSSPVASESTVASSC